MVELADVGVAEYWSGDFADAVLQANQRQARRTRDAGFVTRSVGGRMPVAVALVVFGGLFSLAHGLLLVAVYCCNCVGVFSAFMSKLRALWQN